MARPHVLDAQQQEIIQRRLEDPECRVVDLAEEYDVSLSTIRRLLPDSRRRDYVIPVDLTGRTFGSWTVKEKADGQPSVRGHSFWVCVCACGATAEVRGTFLTHGVSRRCSTCRTLRRNSPKRRIT